MLSIAYIKGYNLIAMSTDSGMAYVLEFSNLKTANDKLEVVGTHTINPA